MKPYSTASQVSSLIQPWLADKLSFRVPPPMALIIIDKRFPVSAKPGGATDWECDKEGGYILFRRYEGLSESNAARSPEVSEDRKAKEGTRASLQDPTTMWDAKKAKMAKMATLSTLPHVPMLELDRWVKRNGRSLV
ncbi:hypothetical protein CPAR01_05354 [Colletotrichum paranaense]|uniref:Uncharacterized protein n=1 Tax=Colletotrichum paranaense TaxID=1914294 RepID=A0ABQ9SR25_9PEZI|nr:uncharacterized protein CPAR01_05354 [Colletotrichum paranaense]KAK1541967.1 hypothetical protein CPAR01_05354 [Colletotrichum paranaense]